MKSRGAGGTYRDIVPLTRVEHLDLDVMPEGKFEKRYGRSKQSVRNTAPKYAAMWDERKGYRSE